MIAWVEVSLSIPREQVAAVETALQGTEVRSLFDHVAPLIGRQVLFGVVLARAGPAGAAAMVGFFLGHVCSPELSRVIGERS